MPFLCVPLLEQLPSDRVTLLLAFPLRLEFKLLLGGAEVRDLVDLAVERVKIARDPGAAIAPGTVLLLEIPGETPGPGKLFKAFLRNRVEDDPPRGRFARRSEALLELFEMVEALDLRFPWKPHDGNGNGGLPPAKGKLRVLLEDPLGLGSGGGLGDGHGGLIPHEEARNRVSVAAPSVARSSWSSP
jgi:hypothetical protein